MDEQMQQQIVALVQAAMQGNQQATQQIQQVMQAAQQGDPQAAQVAQMIQAVAQQLQGQQAKMARFGAKLNYIKQLRGQCPDGYEMKKFAKGGAVVQRCTKCEQGAKNPIDEFKCGRKMKKKMETGGKSKVTLKSEKNSTNKYGDRVTTRRWSDGTTSKRYTPEEGETVYEGRRGERGVAQQDSLYSADWSSKIAPKLKRK